MDAAEFVTFLLAPIGYLGLCASMVLAMAGRVVPATLLVTAAVIATHVFMVWHVRYAWSIAEATRNGYVGFTLFHGALLLIVGALVVKPDTTRPLLVIAFLVVSAGALGAVFRYDVVAVYRIPVMLIAAVGVGFVARASCVWWNARPRDARG